MSKRTIDEDIIGILARTAARGDLCPEEAYEGQCPRTSCTRHKPNHDTAACWIRWAEKQVHAEARERREFQRSIGARFRTCVRCGRTKHTSAYAKPGSTTCRECVSAKHNTKVCTVCGVHRGFRAFHAGSTVCTDCIVAKETTDV